MRSAADVAERLVLFFFTEGDAVIFSAGAGYQTIERFFFFSGPIADHLKLAFGFFPKWGEEASRY